MAMELILSGRVQGVFCRHYCSQNARKLGIRGAASNLHDGTVQVLIECDEEIGQSYIKLLRQNPYGFRFFGSIHSVKINEYYGAIRGDYLF